MLAAAALLPLAGLARADVVLIAHPALAVGSLPQAEVNRLFFGQSARLAGSQAVPLDVDGPLRDQFMLQVLKKQPAQVEKYWARMIFTGKANPPRAVKASEVKAIVSGTPGAISYLERSQLDSSVKVIAVTGS
jgi:ABC-type phosphate transport system substrate-binding protein